MVPVLSIAFMTVSGIIAIGLPIALAVIWRKKYNLKFIPALMGIAAFILFALILEQLLHGVVLKPAADGSIALIKNNPALFVLYGIFAAGVFEETARFLSFHILKKKFKGIGTGLSYGIGHGGIEAVLIAGLAMISNITMSLMINNGNVGMLGDSPAVQVGINALVGTEPIYFLVSGFERIMAVAVHISLSMFVWCAVVVKGKLWMYPAAIVMHAIVNLAPAMYQAEIIDSIWLVEGLVLLPAVLVCIGAYHVCKMLPKEEAITEAAVTPEAAVISGEDIAAEEANDDGTT